MFNNERVNFYFILNYLDIKIFVLKNYKFFVINLKFDLLMLYFIVFFKIIIFFSVGQVVVGEQYRFECLVIGKLFLEYFWFKVN